MRNEEQTESSRRLEEYRIKSEKISTPIDLDDYEELDTIGHIQTFFERKPEKAKKVLR